LDGRMDMRGQIGKGVDCSHKLCMKRLCEEQEMQEGKVRYHCFLFAAFFW